MDKKKVEENENLFFVGLKDGGHISYPYGLGCKNVRF